MNGPAGLWLAQFSGGRAAVQGVSLPPIVRGGRSKLHLWPFNTPWQEHIFLT